MQYKWDQLKAIFGRSSRFVLETQLQPTAECSFLRRPVGPSPAYAWVRTEQAPRIVCHACSAAQNKELQLRGGLGAAHRSAARGRRTWMAVTVQRRRWAGTGGFDCVGARG
jgi:hypothetical protein